jgi:hypothetical protein
MLLRNRQNKFLHQDLWKKKSCSNLWARIVEKSFSKKSLKKNLFVVLFFSAQDQKPKLWWSEKAKHLQKNNLKNLLRRKQCLRQRRARKCYNGWKWTQMNSNGLDMPIWRAYSTWSGLWYERTYYNNFYELGKQWRMEGF